MDENTSIFGTDAFVEQMNNISGMIQENNAAAAAAAEDQRNWTERMWDKQSEYNAEQAALNRDWQEYMSNTAHQREVADLKAAGLNPILSASGGNGAAVTSGATASSMAGSGQKADTDHSGTTALVSMLNAFLQSQTSLLNQTVSARSNEAIAEKYTAMDQLLTEMNNTTSRYVSDNALRSAQTTAGAMEYSADQSLHSSQLMSEANKYIADLNANTSLTLEQKKEYWEKWMKEHYPGNTTDAAWTLLNGILGRDNPVDFIANGIEGWKDTFKYLFDTVSSAVDKHNTNSAFSSTSGKY